MSSLTLARKRVDEHPDDMVALQELALLLSRDAQHDEAMELGLRLAQSCARDATAWNSLGLIMQRARVWENAELAYRRALLLRPGNAQVMGRLAVVLRERGALDDALGFFQRSVDLDGNSAEVWSSFGNALIEAGLFDTAVKAQERAVELCSDRPNFWANLSNGYRQQGAMEQALQAVGRGLELAPKHAGLHWNKALIHLMRNEFELGFKGYEWRYLRTSKQRPDWMSRVWDGQATQDVVEFHTEQGFGDALQFARFLTCVTSEVGELVLRVHPKMVGILSGLNAVCKVVSRDEPSMPNSRHHFLMSIPSLLERIEIQGGAYLRADPLRVDAWRRRLAANESHPQRLRVGLCWQGNPKFEADRLRSPPLRAMEPLVDIKGVRFLSLQKFHGLEQLERYGALMGIEDLGKELDNGDQAFVDTAAAMKNLDLVITSDTATAHLAGALGVETWVALNSSPDWRWGLNGEKSLWYDSLRLFRQPIPGAWDTVFEAMSEALLKRVGRTE